MNKNLLIPEIQEFIREHMDEDPTSLLLKGSPFEEVSAPEIVDQILARKKSLKKHPTWSNTNGIVFPAKVSIEQSSSEITAQYKADLVSGNSLIDLTGGMGVDSYFFSKRIDQVVYCEQQEEVFECAMHNFNILGHDNMEGFCGDSLECLSSRPKNYDWIYLDPARRDGENNRKFQLEDTVPNILEHLPLLQSKSKFLLLKTAPLLDIRLGLRVLKKTKEIHVISVNNEVKELLWLIDHSIGDSAEPNPKMICVDFHKEISEPFVFDLSDERESPSQIGPISKYLFEPNVAVMKAGAFKIIGEKFRLIKLHKNSHLYSSPELLPFPGRRFEIIEIITYNKKLLKKRFGKSRLNILKRNYPESVSNIRKKTGIQDGGDEFLIFSTDSDEKRVAIYCKRV